MNTNNSKETENLVKPSATIRDFIQRKEEVLKEEPLMDLKNILKSILNENKRERIPPALYDASGYIDQTLAVMESVPDIVSLSKGGIYNGDPQQVSYLLEAAYTLLKLARTEIQLLETQLLE